MAYDFNSLTKQADEASNRDKFYTDFEDVDPSVLHQITELTNWMRTKAKGSDVREVIAQLFERTWLEESKKGNANMEVAKARGRFPVLNERLNNADRERAENAQKLAQKANRDEVTNVMTPKGTLAYASLPKSGNQVGWYYYCPDGDGTHGAGNYVWNGTSWFFGGTGDEGYNLLKEDLENQKVVPMASIDPRKMKLDKYDVVITEGKYLTGRNTTSHTPTMTQNSNYEYDIIDIAINPNNTTITVPYDTAQSAGQAFVLYTEGLYSNNVTPDNVNKNQIGVIGVGVNSYTVNLHASAIKYERVAFTVPRGRRDFYFQNPDEGEVGKIIDKKIYDNFIIAPVNMFYSIGAIGDSYTAGSALASDGVTWQDVTELSWIATMAKRAGIYYSNYGKGGATTKSYITDKLPSVLSGQAKDLYFIALGINDYLQNLTVGTVADIKDDYTLNGESYFGWYGSIISQVQAHAPKAKIVLVKIWTNGTAKIPYDNAITEIASHFELPVIDPYDDAFFNSSLYLDNMVSGHPTPMTYPCMGLAMERLFSRCVIENPDYFKFATIG